MPDTHFPDVYMGVAFNGDAFDTGVTPVWSNLSARCKAISTAGRGRQYELDQNQAGAMDVSWVNIDEALNPVNTGSPYYPNVQPYRRILTRAMWPNGGTGNLINLTGNVGDPSFESYTAGAAVPWITAIGAGVVPTVVVGTVFHGTKSLTYIVTSAAGAQGVSWTVPCIPGRQYTSSAYVIQQFANTTGISVSGIGAGSSTAVTVTYVRLSITFTATQPTHTVVVQSSPTTFTGIVNIDAVQHEPGGSASAFTMSGPVIKSIWTRGYVERWPLQWDETGSEGRSSTPCVGPFALVSAANLRTAYADAVMSKGPALFYKLAEASAATSFVDSSGNAGPSLATWSSPAGAGTAPAAGTAHGMAGDPSGTGVTFVQGVASGGSSVIGSIIGTGRAFNSTHVDFPSTATAGTWTATFTGWVQMAYPLTGSVTIWRAGTAGPPSLAPYGGLLTADVNGSLNAAIFSGLTLANAASAAHVVDDGKAHHVAMVVSQIIGGSVVWNVDLYVDGAFTATSSASSAFNPITPSSDFMIGGRNDGTDLRSVMGGVVSLVALYTRGLSAAEIADLYQAALGYNGENSTTRTVRQLALVGFTPSSTSAGLTTMGPSTVVNGDNALSTVQRNAATEFGNVFESADGIAVMGRSTRYLTTSSSYTFGENVAGGEYPYEGDIAFDLDPSLVINYADVTRTKGITAHVEDAASQRRYTRRPFTRTTDGNSDAEVIDAATWTVNGRKNALLRVASVTFNPAATRVPFGDTTLWPMVLTLEIGTRVTLKRRPKSANAGAGITMSGDYFVESIVHHDIDFEAGTWLTTLQLSPTGTAQPWILQDATYGVLGSTTVLGF